VQDLRLPLHDGDPIQLLTTRDTGDPDALAVLRHSSAHLLAEAVTRLYPGVKPAIGPPIENGFYYDFEFPEPITDEDLGRIEEEIRRELAEGRASDRQEISRDEACARFEQDQAPYKVELVDDAEEPTSLYTQGDFTDLCRGPHLQNSKPIKALRLTGLAGAYWRGNEKNPQLTRIYGTAFFEKKDLDEHLRRLEQVGIPAGAAERSGQLEVRRWEEAYLREGHFDQNRMLALIEEVLTGGKAQGFPLTRLVANMEWALEDKPGVNDMVEFESRVNYTLDKYDDAICCCYDVSRFSASVIMDAMRVHPALIIGGIYQENPFYVPPEEFLRELRERAGQNSTSVA